MFNQSLGMNAGFDPNMLLQSHLAMQVRICSALHAALLDTLTFSRSRLYSSQHA